MLSKGDIENYRDFIDYIVIAGLSAGREIKDLYSWIIENNLTDRVYLIGAGYENDYVDKYIYEEPEITIFNNAKVITSRTEKAPRIIRELGLPFHHINCPAILSVPEIKEFEESKKLEKVIFSIQLPHQVGVPNHSCSKEMYMLALEILSELVNHYEIEIVAHHKSEYFHFLNFFRKLDLNIPIKFSSYYQDLFEFYKEADLVITTRLHSSLFANGIGIPGIIVNDTDRHVHCLQGFKHSHWVNNNAAFKHIFDQLLRKSLKTTAYELKVFKEDLLQNYVNVLSDVFERNNPACTNIQQNPKSNIVNLFKNGASDSEVKKRVLSSLKMLEKDYWLERNIEKYTGSFSNNENSWFDTVSFLNWYSRIFKPGSYLEVGVRRGRSMIQVMSQSESTKAVGIDLWIEDYSCIPAQNILTTNPGPEFVLAELKKFGIMNLPELIKGDSHSILPAYFRRSNAIQYFDLILVDGDHSYEGARSDLDICINHLKESGVLVFDDINHSAHPELKSLWHELKVQYPTYLFFEDSSGTGTGIMIKPPFGKYVIHGSNKQCIISNSNKLPVHFFTIVLNGKPFIEYHINVFKQLPFEWHWHIIEGVADLVHDSSWVLQYGGMINNEIHNQGLSNDGTTDYINELALNFPHNITVHRKEANSYWSGKVEMVNKPLENISEECLLWQVDVDELWSADQIIETRKMFSLKPEKTAAFFYCNYFVGEKRVIVTENTYGNHSEYEWLRVWRYKPGDKWISHEPPKLTRTFNNGNKQPLDEINVFTHDETRSHNLVFQHYAYATESQLKFKEIYYGYNGSVIMWKKLNSSNVPLKLRQYFNWVTDKAIVDDVRKLGVNPIANLNNGKWNFNYQSDDHIIKTFLTSDDFNLEAEDEIASGNLQRAKHLLEISKELDENNTTVLNNLAVIQILEENYNSADLLLNGILALDPGNQIALKNKKTFSTIKRKNSKMVNSIIENKNAKKFCNSHKSYKFQINFDLNDGCNLNCVMCGNVPNRNYKNQNVTPWEVFETNFVDVFKYAHDFQFGCYFEPLMVPFFEKAVWSIKEKLPNNIKGTIISNGMLLKDSKIRTIIDSDIFKKIRFSIDSVSEELFKNIRVGGSLKLLITNIQKLIDYKNKVHSKSLIEGNFTIMQENILELPKLLQFAKEIGIDSITTHKLTPQESTFVTPEKQKMYAESINLAGEIAKQSNILFCGQVYNNSTFEESINKTCGYAKKNYVLLTLDYKGNVNHGCKHYGQSIGNLKEQSIEEILHQEKYKNLIFTIENSNYNACSDCGMYSN